MYVRMYRHTYTYKSIHPSINPISVGVAKCMCADIGGAAPPPNPPAWPKAHSHAYMHIFL